MTDQTEVAYDDLEYTPSGLFLLHGQPFSGITVDRDAEGRKISEVPFVDGRENGTARSWHQNGQLEGETPYTDGMIHGVRREFFEDGVLRSEEVFECGALMRKEIHDHSGATTERYERPATDVLYQNVLKRRARG